jgi:hypothetical protein
MQSSEDIGSVVEAVFGELTAPGLPLTTTTIEIYVSDTETEIWLRGENGRALEPFTIARRVRLNAVAATITTIYLKVRNERKPSALTGPQTTFWACQR